MNCAFDKEKLTAFYDGELDAAGKTEVERHISACSECLRDLGEIKSASLLVKELPRPRAPRSIAEGVSREIASTGRVHSFSRARSLVLWATAAAAGLFIVANVIFFAGGPPAEPPMAKAPRPEPALAVVPAPGVEKKHSEERQDAPAKEGKLQAGYRAELAEKSTGLLEKKVESDRASVPPEAPKGEPAKGLAGKFGEARKADADGAKAKMEEKLRDEKAAEPPRPTAAAKPAAPAPPPPAAVPATPPPPAPESKQRQGELAEYLQNRLARGNRAEAQNQEAVNVTVTAPQIAKVRPQVEDIVRRYAGRANFDPAARPQQQLHAEDKKVAAVRREAGAGPITLDLTPAEYDAMKGEIEKATGAQLVMATPTDAYARLRGAPAPAGKAGPGEAERAVQSGAAAGGGLAKAPAAPNADDLRRKAADENLSKKEQQAPAGQQAPGNTGKDDPLANKDKNAQENESRHLKQGETRIRIVINFLEVPLAEKK